MNPNKLLYLGLVRLAASSTLLWPRVKHKVRIEPSVPSPKLAADGLGIAHLLPCMIALGACGLTLWPISGADTSRVLSSHP